MTDKGYYDPPRANGHDVHESGAANGCDTGAPMMLLDGSTVPAGIRERGSGQKETEVDPVRDDVSVDEEPDPDALQAAADETAQSIDAPDTEEEKVAEADTVADEGGAEREAAPEFTDEERWRHLRMGEALLFASAEPLRTEQIAERLPDGADVEQVLADLGEYYRDRGVNLMRVAGGWAFRTATDLAFLMERERVEQRKLSRAALETLAIIAYHQPVTRAEIEDVRGVSVSKGTLDVLMEIGWVRVRGRRQTPGRPVTYGTSDMFLEHFGLDRISDLPGLDELKAAGLLDTRMPTNIQIPRPSDEEETAEGDDEDEPLYARDDEIDDDRFGEEADIAEVSGESESEVAVEDAGDIEHVDDHEAVSAAWEDPDSDDAGADKEAEFESALETHESDEPDASDYAQFGGNGHDVAASGNDEEPPEVAETDAERRPEDDRADGDRREDEGKTAESRSSHT